MPTYHGKAKPWCNQKKYIQRKHIYCCCWFVLIHILKITASKMCWLQMPISNSGKDSGSSHCIFHLLLISKCVELFHATECPAITKYINWWGLFLFDENSYRTSTRELHHLTVLDQMTSLSNLRTPQSPHTHPYWSPQYIGTDSKLQLGFSPPVRNNS